ncbi:MAG TPA: hypothetical protein VL280_00290 [Burkholderiales bacterium]|jgi:hypothetical protein|nr:hypothetical protein [Burkholderiales bacterium]
MNDTVKPQRAVWFSSVHFRRLPMEAKLPYLRAAIVNLRNQGYKPHTLSKAGFERLTLERKIEFLDYATRVFRARQQVLRKAGRVPAAPISPVRRRLRRPSPP